MKRRHVLHAGMAALAPWQSVSSLLAAEDTLLIKGGRIVDPARGVNSIGDLAVVDGLISHDTASLPVSTRVIDATGLLVVPGLIDVHVHARGQRELADGTVTEDADRDHGVGLGR